MSYTHSTLNAADGTELVTYLWQLEAPKAMVVIVHGYAEHAGRYAAFAEKLVDAGYAVAALDHRGHGRSAGERANVTVFRQYVDDLRRFIESLRERYGELPLALFGHSMGGVIAGQLVLEHPHKASALILSAPYLKNAVPVPPWLVRLADGLSRWLPSLPLIRLDSRGLSRDAAVVAAYDSDPLVYTGRVKARLASELRTAADYLLARAAAIRLPTLIIHGDADPIADVAGSRALYAALGAKDKTLDVVPGGYHEPLNDLDRERVTALIVDWLRPRLIAERSAVS